MSTVEKPWGAVSAYPADAFDTPNLTILSQDDLSISDPFSQYMTKKSAWRASNFWVLNCRRALELGGPAAGAGGWGGGCWMDEGGLGGQVCDFVAGLLRQVGCGRVQPGSAACHFGFVYMDLSLAIFSLYCISFFCFSRAHPLMGGIVPGVPCTGLIAPTFAG